MRALAVVVALAVTAASAQPADAPVVLEVERGEVRTPTGRLEVVGRGVYMNETANRNAAAYILDLERQRDDLTTPAIVVGVALVLGFAGGFAAAKLLPPP